jgi:hypothetical protein
MTEIPPELLAEIEADVQRYRCQRLAAARKRLTPQYLDKLAKRTEREWPRFIPAARLFGSFAFRNPHQPIAGNNGSFGGFKDITKGN